MRNCDNIRAATTVRAASEYSKYRYSKPVRVRGWPGERPKCRLIKSEEWSMEAVASVVEQYLATHSRCVVLCRYDDQVTELSAALTSTHLLYTGQQQEAVERWLEGEDVLVTADHLFRGCEARAVVRVDRYGGWRTAATRAVAALLFITSDKNINCDHVYNYFDQFL